MRRRHGDGAAVAMPSSSSLTGCFCGMFCCYICVLVLAATVLCCVLCIGHKMRSSDTLKPPKHRGDFLDVAAVNDSLSRPSLACYVGLLILAYLFSSLMDNEHVMRAFFKNIPNNWSIWADGLNKLWDTWGIFS